MVFLIITCYHMPKADYYESSTWLTEEEKTALDAKDKARKETVSNMNKRSNNFSFNLHDGYASFTLFLMHHSSYLLPTTTPHTYLLTHSLTHLSALYMNH